MAVMESTCIITMITHAVNLSIHHENACPEPGPGTWEWALSGGAHHLNIKTHSQCASINGWDCLIPIKPSQVNQALSHTSLLHIYHWDGGLPTVTKLVSTEPELDLDFSFSSVFFQLCCLSASSVFSKGFNCTMKSQSLTTYYQSVPSINLSVP
jgi:hypothetical protein